MGSFIHYSHHQYTTAIRCSSSLSQDPNKSHEKMAVKFGPWILKLGGLGGKLIVPSSHHLRVKYTQVLPTMIAAEVLKHLLTNI